MASDSGPHHAYQSSRAALESSDLAHVQGTQPASPVSSYNLYHQRSYPYTTRSSNPRQYQPSASPPAHARASFNMLPPVSPPYPSSTPSHPPHPPVLPPPFGRDHAVLPPPTASSRVGSGMSISSILGGGGDSREPPRAAFPPPTSQPFSPYADRREPLEWNQRRTGSLHDAPVPRPPFERMAMTPDGRYDQRGPYGHRRPPSDPQVIPDPRSQQPMRRTSLSGPGPSPRGSPFGHDPSSRHPHDDQPTRNWPPAPPPPYGHSPGMPLPPRQYAEDPHQRFAPPYSDPRARGPMVSPHGMPPFDNGTGPRPPGPPHSFSGPSLEHRQAEQDALAALSSAELRRASADPGLHDRNRVDMGPGPGPSAGLVRSATASLIERDDRRPDSGSLMGPRSTMTPTGTASFGADEGTPHPKIQNLVSESRRPGRISPSPIPQAVQGAHAKRRGPANEPGIKYEFARMFYGIGTGVASAVSSPVPPENSNGPRSLPASPPRDDGARSTPLSHRRDDVDLSQYRTSSVGPSGSRRSREEELKPELEDEVSAAAMGRSQSARDPKRGRLGRLASVQAAPHHHPHHHHHHHHHVTNAGAVNGTAVGAGTQPGAVSTPERRHHHHHHHHHHHAAAGKLAATPPMVQPRLSIDSHWVLDAVRDLPRQDLGTFNYATRTRRPRDDPLSDENRFPFVSTPQPMPRFEGRANCVFTIRVPEYFLTDECREEICVRRALWGADVYTDDSDALAIAMHSGWLRGAWDLDVDPTLLDLSTLETAESQRDQVASSTTEARITLSEPPSQPLLPLPSRQLHLTFQVLPRLEQYASTVRHGIRSHDWAGTPHDGMSVRLETMAWVDPKREGAGSKRSATATTGEARRKRLFGARRERGMAVGLSTGTAVAVQ